VLQTSSLDSSALLFLLCRQLDNGLSLGIINRS